jgi:hypothetical protein
MSGSNFRSEYRRSSSNINKNIATSSGCDDLYVDNSDSEDGDDLSSEDFLEVGTSEFDGIKHEDIMNDNNDDDDDGSNSKRMASNNLISMRQQNVLKTYLSIQDKMTILASKILIIYIRS